MLGCLSDPGTRRYEGVLEGLAAAGAELPEHLVVRTDAWLRSSGYAAAQQLVAASPRRDALLCFNDALAVGALKALGDLGVRVPQDVAVVGWDDVTESRYTTPTLTSVSPDKPALAGAAVDGFLAQIEERTLETQEHVTGLTLVVCGNS